MNLRQKLLNEMDTYLKEETFDKEGILLNVKNLVAYKEASISEKETIKKILEEHRVGTSGIYRKGFKLYFDSKTMDLIIKDIHVVNIKVISKHNRPYAILTFNDNIKSFHARASCYARKEIINEDGSKKIIPIQLKILATELDNALYGSKYNIVGEKELKEFDTTMIRFDMDSIETFYGFRNQAFVKFTQPMVDKFWDHADSTLKRYDTNLTTHSNDWGLTFAIWECNLIEIDWGNPYLDETITEEEVKAIIKGHEQYSLPQEILNRYKIAHNDNEEDKNNKISQILKTIEKIQQCINKNDEFIIDETILNSGYSTTAFENLTKEERLNKKKGFLCRIDGSYGFDCGFIYFRFKDEKLSQLAKEASAYGCDKFFNDGKFCLNLPYENQSTTLKRYEARAIEKLLKENALPEISYVTVLD